MSAKERKEKKREKEEEVRRSSSRGELEKGTMDVPALLGFKRAAPALPMVRTTFSRGVRGM